MLLTSICNFLSFGPRTFDVRHDQMTCFDQWNVTGCDMHHLRAETVRISMQFSIFLAVEAGRALPGSPLLAGALTLTLKLL